MHLHNFMNKNLGDDDQLPPSPKYCCSAHFVTRVIHVSLFVCSGLVRRALGATLNLSHPQYQTSQPPSTPKLPLTTIPEKKDILDDLYSFPCVVGPNQSDICNKCGFEQV